MHVSHSVDADRLADHAVSQDEREAANDPTAYAEIRPYVRKQWADGWEANDQLHRSLDSRVETHATAGTFHVVSIGGCVQLGACGRRELDRLHVRF
jgi:hypothetical protein